MSNKQVKQWGSKFGDEYNLRNDPQRDIKARDELWRTIIGSIISSNKNMVPSSYLEIGAGEGRNIMAIHTMYEDDHKPDITSVEVNAQACASLGLLPIHRHKIINKAWEDVDIPASNFDVVFTSGVLIHVSKSNLREFIKKMYYASKKYIVVCEYFSPKRRMIPYHGKMNLLWADDFGSFILDNFGVRLVSYGFRWKRVTGLDDLTYFVFEKVN